MLKKRRGKSRDSVATPPLIYRLIKTFKAADREWWDPCPFQKNWKAGVHTCGLTESWETHEYIYCNPPFSFPKPWVKKCIESFQKFPTIKCIVLLLKNDHLANSYCNTLEKYADLMVITKRIQFLGYNKNAGFGNCLVHFHRGDVGNFATIS